MKVAANQVILILILSLEVVCSVHYATVALLFLTWIYYLLMRLKTTAPLQSTEGIDYK